MDFHTNPKPQYLESGFTANNDQVLCKKMTVRPASFAIDSQRFKAENFWTVGGHHLQGMDFSLSATQPVFMVTAENGFNVCEDFRLSKKVLNVATGSMRPQALSFNPHQASEVVLAFPAGQLLVVDALHRTRSPALWFNTNNSCLSDAPTVLVRWLSQHAFGVLLTDNTFWIYQTKVSQESRDTANLLDNTSPSSHQISVATSSKNPVEAWKFCFGKVTDLQTTHGESGRLLVTGTSDGQVKVYNYAQRTLLSIFYSYFGGVRCLSLAFGLVAVGGEDDAVSVWHLKEKRLVTRCEGHRSWVTGLAFKSKNKLLSIGQDGLLCLWTFENPLGCAQEDLLLSYPPRREWTVTKPTQAIEVSSAAAAFLGVTDSHLVVGDEWGVVWLWSAK